MQSINIKNQKTTKNGWEFVVEVGENEDVLKYTVYLSENYWKKLTNGRAEPNNLIIKSFKFLLKRESKESILKEFNLEVINKYFPEYESEILLNFNT